MKKIMTISLIVIIVISGCGTQITSRQMRTAEDATDWPIVWSSERGNPYARDGKIYIDTGYLEKKGVSHQLMYVVKHESAHLDGYWWECNRRCLMNPVIPWFGTRKICSKCRARLRPTTSDWLGLD